MTEFKLSETQLAEAHNTAADGEMPKVTMSKRDIIRGIAAGSIIALGGAGCAYNEELGRSQLLFVSRGQMAQLAASAWGDLKKQERVLHQLPIRQSAEPRGPADGPGGGREPARLGVRGV